MIGQRAGDVFPFVEQWDVDNDPDAITDYKDIIKYITDIHGQLAELDIPEWFSGDHESLTVLSEGSWAGIIRYFAGIKRVTKWHSDDPSYTMPSQWLVKLFR